MNPVDSSQVPNNSAETLSDSTKTNGTAAGNLAPRSIEYLKEEKILTKFKDSKENFEKLNNLSNRNDANKNFESKNFTLINPDIDTDGNDKNTALECPKKINQIGEKQFKSEQTEDQKEDTAHNSDTWEELPHLDGQDDDDLEGMGPIGSEEVKEVVEDKSIAKQDKTVEVKKQEDTEINIKEVKTEAKVVENKMVKYRKIKTDFSRVAMTRIDQAKRSGLVDAQMLKNVSYVMKTYVLPKNRKDSEEVFNELLKQDAFDKNGKPPSAEEIKRLKEFFISHYEYAIKIYDLNIKIAANEERLRELKKLLDNMQKSEIQSYIEKMLTSCIRNSGIVLLDSGREKWMEYFQTILDQINKQKNNILKKILIEKSNQNFRKKQRIQFKKSLLKKQEVHELFIEEFKRQNLNFDVRVLEDKEIGEKFEEIKNEMISLMNLVIDNFVLAKT